MKTPFHALLSHVQKVTFIEILATICISVMFVIIGILYEARTTAVQRYFIPESQLTLTPLANQLVLSQDSIDLVTQFAKAHTEVAVVGVVSVNLPTNQRTSLLYLFNDKDLEKFVGEQRSLHKLRTSYPLFSENTAQNSMVSSLLAGEFACATTDPASMMPVPDFGGRLKTSCGVPIPPFYGRMTGYLVMHSTRELSIYEAEALKAASLRLSIDLYYNDIVRPRESGQIILNK